jgi:hypothetical protein
MVQFFSGAFEHPPPFGEDCKAPFAPYVVGQSTATLGAFCRRGQHIIRVRDAIEAFRNWYETWVLLLPMGNSLRKTMEEMIDQLLLDMRSSSMRSLSWSECRTDVVVHVLKTTMYYAMTNVVYADPKRSSSADLAVAFRLAVSESASTQALQAIAIYSHRNLWAPAASTTIETAPTRSFHFMISLGLTCMHACWLASCSHIADCTPVA